MYQERIRCTPIWREEYARYDTVLVGMAGEGRRGMQGLVIARIRLFFTLTLDTKPYSCALVEWFITGDEPDEDTGMWVVKPEFYGNGQRAMDVIHTDSIVRGAHLLPVFGASFVPTQIHFSNALDVFQAYFVNNYIDHHSHELLA